MRISVAHTTTYSYSSPVLLEPHVVRLRPREDGSQRTLAFSLEIAPGPAGRAECLDQEGNVVTHAWFASPTDSLSVHSMFQVETLRQNPFDFLLCSSDRDLPIRYPHATRHALAPYLNGNVDGAVREFGARIAGQAGNRTMDFLASLNRTLVERTRQLVRPVGTPYPPEQTLAAGEGSCRDTALLFCAACRAMGVAARFVSGYEYQTATAEQGGELHAWAEVYLEGGGWRGYDPSRGLAVTASYVPLAAAASPEMAAPVSGTFRGSAESSMSYSILLQAA